MRVLLEGPVADLAAGAASARQIAAHLGVVADGLEAAAAVYPVWSAVTWSGVAAFEAMRVVERQPHRFRFAATVFRQAASALSGHAEHLRVAAAVEETARRSPAAAASGLRAHARSLAEASAAELAHRLGGLAARAPAEPSLPERMVGKVMAWHDEAAVGAGESTAALLGLAARGIGVLNGSFSSRTVGEVRCAGSALTTMATHPGSTFKALVDWDTWASNPPRAAGRLVPDLFGGAGGAHAARVVAAGKDAVRTAASRAAYQAGGDRVAARAAQVGLHDQALAARPARRAWTGPEGLHLPAVQVGQARRFHALSRAAERVITADLRAIVRSFGARLDGLPQRVKSPDSMLRKLASSPGGGFGAALEEVNDVVRYTVVAPPADYATTVGRVTAELRAAGYHATQVKNFWTRPDKPYQGINSTWIVGRSGVTFEVQFHTPMSRRVTVATHPVYEEMRVLPEALRGPFREILRAEYGKVPVPPEVSRLGTGSLPPAVPWRPPAPLPDHARAWAAAAAATPALTTPALTTPANQ